MTQQVLYETSSIADIASSIEISYFTAQSSSTSSDMAIDLTKSPPSIGSQEDNNIETIENVNFQNDESGLNTQTRKSE